MEYDDLNNKINFQIIQNNILWKQTHIMFIPSSHKYMQNVEKEELAKYGINEVYKDFIFKENKILFFIAKYLNIFNEILNSNSLIFKENNISFTPNELFDEMIYYFDSIIASFSVIIESQQMDALVKYLNCNKIKEFYPSRQKYGLWWQIYMLRNRILHYTEARYDNTREACSRFIDFSSKILMIRIENNNIKMESTLIDIYKNLNIKTAIETAINNRERNVFDLLFPNKSAKGPEKGHPNILYINNDIFFDYATSGIKLIDEIQELLNKVNHEFVIYFSKDYDDVNNLLNSRTSLQTEKEAYSIKDVFKNLT